MLMLASLGRVASQAVGCRERTNFQAPRRRVAPVGGIVLLQSKRENFLMQFDNVLSTITPSDTQAAGNAELKTKTRRNSGAAAARTNGSSLMEFEWTVQKIPSSTTDES